MTTEQREAVEYLEHLRDEYKKSAKKRKEEGEATGYGTLEDLDKLNALEIDVVLNLIQEQEKEIDYWKNGFERELESNRENAVELLKQDLIIRKKDNIIDLIINTVYKRFKAELLLEYGFENEEQFKQYFEGKVEDETK